MELILFIAAQTVLCFGFMTKTVDNTGMASSPLNSACTASRPFLLLALPRQQVGCGWARRWEGTQPGQPTYRPNGYPTLCDGTLSNESWGKEE